jgi:hypothetical protein
MVEGQPVIAADDVVALTSAHGQGKLAMTARIFERRRAAVLLAEARDVVA